MAIMKHKEVCERCKCQAFSTDKKVPDVKCKSNCDCHDTFNFFNHGTPMRRLVTS